MMTASTITWMILFGVISFFPDARFSTNGETKPNREEGEFRIQFQGKDIGTEKFAIINNVDAVTSTSVVEFRRPGASRQKVHLETKMEMDNRFVPRSYKCNIDVDGRKGLISSSIEPHQAMFEYAGEELPRKSGLLVGDSYTILDSNVFHHFVFLARKFVFGSREKAQRMEVVIPQEMDSGTLSLSEIGREAMRVRGKTVEVHHLKLDSGSAVMDVWVDESHILQKIAVPSNGIDVIRAR